MAFKSAYTGAKIDELLGLVSQWQQNPSSILTNITGEQILAKLTGQQIIDKINTVTEIKFTKYVNASAGAGKK